MPEAINITLFSYVPLRSRPGLAGFLDVLESIPTLTPTHWGQDERARNPYNRAELIEQVCAYRGMFLTPGLRRRKPLRYEAYFDAYSDGLGWIQFNFDPGPQNTDIPRLFNFADALVDYLRPALGYVHRFWRVGDRNQEYDASGAHSLEDLQKYGPDRVCARTWYGPHLTGLVGLPLLEASGALVRETPWGGTQIDLTERPWETEPEELAAAQERVMGTLAMSQVYGDFTDFFKRRPGARWAPLPDTRPILPVTLWPQPPRP